MTAEALQLPEAVLGSITPRLFTPPLVTGAPGPCGCGCALTPETSYGFDVIDFATDVLLFPPDPWQRWALIHGCELLPDGRPRFRQLLLLVSRQNGKSAIAVILTAFWQFVDTVPMILGTSTKLDYAKEAWDKTVKLVERAKLLDAYHDKRWTRNANGEQESWTRADSRYKIAASNDQGGRSLTIHRLVLDELRHHYSYLAWGASVPAGNAVRDFQVWALSNAGDDRSVVLNDLRKAALAFIETGEGWDRFGLLEWSAPEGADPLDVHALAQANPNLGYRLDAEALLGDAVKAVKAGGEALTMFKTEVMCIRVPHANPAIDSTAYARALLPGTLEGVRDRVAMVFDVANSMQHATLYAAAVLPDGTTRVAAVKEWSGAGCADAAARELPGVLGAMRVKPRLFGWLPGSPAAAVATKLKDRDDARRTAWPPRGVQVEELRGELTAVCMGFAELVSAGKLARVEEPLLDGQALAAEKLPRGDAWVFSRKGEGDCDALYAAAGAAYLAAIVPPPPARLRMVTADDLVD